MRGSDEEDEEGILAGHSHATRDRLAVSGVLILMLNDTTEFNRNPLPEDKKRAEPHGSVLNSTPGTDSLRTVTLLTAKIRAAWMRAGQLTALTRPTRVVRQEVG